MLFIYIYGRHTKYCRIEKNTPKASFEVKIGPTDAENHEESENPPQKSQKSVKKSKIGPPKFQQFQKYVFLELGAAFRIPRDFLRRLDRFSPQKKPWGPDWAQNKISQNYNFSPPSGKPPIGAFSI